MFDVLLTVIAVAATVFAVVQARVASTARAEAVAARDEIRALQEGSGAGHAFEHDEIAVHWMYRRLNGTLYVLQNIGNKLAQSALVEDVSTTPGLVTPVTGERRDVLPQDGLHFHVHAHAIEFQPRIRTTWHEDDATMQHADEADLLLP